MQDPGCISSPNPETQSLSLQAVKFEWTNMAITGSRDLYLVTQARSRDVCRTQNT